MHKKPNKNTTDVANDCMCYFLVKHLKTIVDYDRRHNRSLSALAEAMEQVLLDEIPRETMQRIERTRFLDRMEWEFAEHGLIPFTVFKHLTEL